MELQPQKMYDFYVLQGFIKMTLQIPNIAFLTEEMASEQELRFEMMEILLTKMDAPELDLKLRTDMYEVVAQRHQKTLENSALSIQSQTLINMIEFLLKSLKK